MKLCEKDIGTFCDNQTMTAVRNAKNKARFDITLHNNCTQHNTTLANNDIESNFSI